MKKGFGYELMCLLSCFLILFSSCGSSLPQDIQPEPAPINSKPAVVRPQWFWQGAWWGTTGALAPEAITTIQQNPWILSGARLARQAALGVSDAPAFDFQGARQIWNEQAQRLSVLIPFVGDTSPFGVTVNIAPVFFWFGEHERRISSVSYGGFTTVQAQAGRIYPQNVNIAAAQQANVIHSSVFIKSTGQLGSASMIVASRSSQTLINSFSTLGDVANQTQIRTLFNPRLSPQALVIVQCIFPNEPNPNNLPICSHAIVPDKDYSVPPSGTPVPAAPETSSNNSVNCTALAISLGRQYAALALAIKAFATSSVGNLAICIGATIASIWTPPPFNSWVLGLTISGCTLLAASTYFQYELLNMQREDYTRSRDEYIRLCT